MKYPRRSLKIICSTPKHHKDIVLLFKIKFPQYWKMARIFQNLESVFSNHSLKSKESSQFKVLYHLYNLFGHFIMIYVNKNEHIMPFYIHQMKTNIGINYTTPLLFKNNSNNFKNHTFVSCT